MAVAVAVCICGDTSMGTGEGEGVGGVNVYEGSWNRVGPGMGGHSAADFSSVLSHPNPEWSELTAQLSNPNPQTYTNHNPHSITNPNPHPEP